MTEKMSGRPHTVSERASGRMGGSEAPGLFPANAHVVCQCLPSKGPRFSRSAETVTAFCSAGMRPYSVLFTIQSCEPMPAHGKGSPETYYSQSCAAVNRRFVAPQSGLLSRLCSVSSPHLDLIKSVIMPMLTTSVHRHR